jgi:hypothetical protein
MANPSYITNFSVNQYFDFDAASGVLNEEAGGVLLNPDARSVANICYAQPSEPTIL